MAPADVGALAAISLLGAALLGAVGACLALVVDGHRPPMIAATLASVLRRQPRAALGERPA